MGFFKKKEETPTNPHMFIYVRLVRQEQKKITSETLNIGNEGSGVYSDGLEQIKISTNSCGNMGGLVVTYDDFLDIYERKLRCDKSEELKGIHERIEEEMQGLTHEWAMETLQAENFLPLLYVANHDILGREKAISYAFRYGYLEGKKDLGNKILDRFGNAEGGATNE